MKFHPILFSPLMVTSILANQKTQTRRLLKFDGIKDADHADFELDGPLVPFPAGVGTHANFITPDKEWINCAMSRYAIGDILYVREEHYRWGTWAKNGISKTGKQKYIFKPEDQEVLFNDNKPGNFRISRDKAAPEIPRYYKRSSLYMPKSAARIFLKITNIRVERAWAISEIDAIAEGVNRWQYELNTLAYEDYIDKSNFFIGNGARLSFKSLWAKINGPETWYSWVWVYDFEKVEKPTDL